MTKDRKESNLRKILVATDFSLRAEIAIERAAQLAEEHSATVTVLHVMTEALREQARKRQIALRMEKDLRRKLAALSPRHENTITIQITTGTPFVEIIRRARKAAVDITLVGAHGAQFIKDLLLGTTAEKIVRKGDRPVLVVKRPVRAPYRNILLPTDFSDHSSQALKFAMRVAPDARYHLLHVFQGIEGQLWRAGFAKSEIKRYRRQAAQQSREEMTHFIRALGLNGRSISRLMRYGRAPDVITTVTRGLRPDLVCVGSAGRTGLSHILLGSVAEHVLREAPSDVLVVRSGTSRFELP
jgi:nucleotide-binding universal stress UspA family protein